MVDREVRDELEVPGHVVMMKMMTRAEIAKEVKAILDEYEAKGITKLGDLPQSVKAVLIKYFDLLGISHDGLKGGD